jgi:hypothetical protein
MSPFAKSFLFAAVAAIVLAKNISSCEHEKAANHPGRKKLVKEQVENIVAILDGAKTSDSSYNLSRKNLDSLFTQYNRVLTAVPYGDTNILKEKNELDSLLFGR